MAKNKNVPVAKFAFASEISTSAEIASVAVDDGGEALETVVLSVFKGQVMPENKTAYQAGLSGVFGAVAGTTKAAVEACLAASNRNPALYVTGGKVVFAVAGDNEPKEAEKFDDLSADEQADMVEKLISFRDNVAEYQDAGVKTRVATLAVARKLNEIREGFATKKRFGIFTAFAKVSAEKARAAGESFASDAEAVAAILTAKNTAGEFQTFGKMPDALIALMPAGKNSAKSAIAWLAGMRSEIAENVVNLIKSPRPVNEAGEAVGVDFAAMSASDCVMAALASDDIAAIAFDAATRMVLDLHKRNIDGVARLLDADAGGVLAVAKADKQFTTKPLFAAERGDELLDVICKGLNGYRTEAEIAADKEAKAKAAPLASRDFSSLPVTDVALHLFRILAGRIDDQTEESLLETAGDCSAIVEMVADMVARVASGEATVADLINPKGETPESEEAAEDDADAAA
jgi:hypothetical protein